MEKKQKRKRKEKDSNLFLLRKSPPLDSRSAMRPVSRRTHVPPVRGRGKQRNGHAKALHGAGGGRASCCGYGRDTLTRPVAGDDRLRGAARGGRDCDFVARISVACFSGPPREAARARATALTTAGIVALSRGKCGPRVCCPGPGVRGSFLLCACSVRMCVWLEYRGVLRVSGAARRWRCSAPPLVTLSSPRYR